MKHTRRTLTLLAVAVTPALAQQSAQADYAAAMMREHRHETPSASPAAQIAPARAVTGTDVMYGMAGGKMLHGYLARPTNAARGGPAIIVVHEWWGLNANIKAVADRYAGEGFTVLAVDLFGRVAATPDSAMVLYQTAMRDIPAGEQNVAAAITYLKGQGARSIGSVGYCFGGHWSLRTGLVGGADIKAVVMYYGAPITAPTQIARLRAPVLGLFGGKDRGIPVDSVRAMEHNMHSAGKQVTIQVYDGADHAFANPSGQAYNAAVADDAWKRSIAFFRTNLR